MTVHLSPSAAGTGNVVGPAASTDNAIARYDGTTGALLQNSLVTVDDAGVLTATGLDGTPLNASQLTTGTVSDARLSSNVPLKNATNVFTATNEFGGVTQFDQPVQAGTSSVDGSIAIVGPVGPYVLFQDQSQAANARFFKIVNAALKLTLEPLADNLLPQNAGLAIDRSGNVTVVGTVTAAGLGTTPLNASNLTSGTLPNARLDANVAVTTSAAIGTTPATSGALRLPNNQNIVWRNAANSADIAGIVVDTANIARITGDYVVLQGLTGTPAVNMNPSGVWYPGADATQDLGSTTKRWKDGYLSGDLNITKRISVGVGSPSALNDGDIRAARDATTGYLFVGTDNTRYFGNDGTRWFAGNYPLTVSGSLGMYNANDNVAGRIVQTITSTGSQSNIALNSGVSHLRCNNASLLTIQGISGFIADGQVLDITSIGTGQVDLAHENGSATAANRLLNKATAMVTSLAAGVGTARYVYDSTTARWRLVSHNQGALIAVAYNAADFTATTGTWTVDAGDIKTRHYYLDGRNLRYVFYIDTTTVSNSTLQLFMNTPFTVVGQSTIQIGSSCFDNGVGTITYVRLIAGNTGVEIGRADQTNFAVATNNTFVRGDLIIPIS